MDRTNRNGREAHYRFISPFAYVLAPFVFVVGWRFSIPLGIAALALVTAVIAMLLRIGSDMTSEGVEVRHAMSRMLVPWSAISGVETVEDWNFGQRIVVIRHDGQRVVLPAPTSMTGHFAEGLSRAKVEVAKHS